MKYNIYISNSKNQFGFVAEDDNGNIKYFHKSERIKDNYSNQIKSGIRKTVDCLGSDCQIQVYSPLFGMFSLKNFHKLSDEIKLEIGNNIECFTCPSNHPSLKIAKKAAKGETIEVCPESFIIPDYIAYTDGSCNNLSPFGEGGAAFVIVEGNNKDNIITSQSKCILGTTNNRAELLAILSAVRYVPEHSMLIIRTDSRYCIDVLTNKKNANCPHMTNGDIITQYFREESRLKDIWFEWVKGHNGDYYNEMADSLAESRREEVRELYRIPIYTYKNRNEPNPRMAKFYNWFETSDDAVKYKDTLTF